MLYLTLDSDLEFPWVMWSTAALHGAETASTDNDALRRDRGISTTPRDSLISATMLLLSGKQCNNFILRPKLYFNIPEFSITLSHYDLKQLIMYSMKTHGAWVQVNFEKKEKENKKTRNKDFWNKGMCKHLLQLIWMTIKLNMHIHT